MTMYVFGKGREMGGAEGHGDTFGFKYGRAGEGNDAFPLCLAPKKTEQPRFPEQTAPTSHGR